MGLDVGTNTNQGPPSGALAKIANINSTTSAMAEKYKLSPSSVKLSNLISGLFLPTLLNATSQQMDNINENGLSKGEDPNHKKDWFENSLEFATIITKPKKILDQLANNLLGVKINPNTKTQFEKEDRNLKTQVKKTLHPEFARKTGSLLFVLEKIIPGLNSLKVMKQNDIKNKNSLLSLSQFFIRPFAFISSVITSVITVPSLIGAQLSVIKGSEKALKITEPFLRIGQVLTPLTTHLNNIFKSLKDYRLGNKVNKLDFISSVLSAPTLVPYALTTAFKVKEIISERTPVENSDDIYSPLDQYGIKRQIEDGHEYHRISTELSNLTEIVAEQLAQSGSDINVNDLKRSSRNKFETLIRNIKASFNNFSNTIVNAPVLKTIAKKVFPVRNDGSIYISNNREELPEDVSLTGENLIANFINKNDLRSIIFDFTHPIQSALSNLSQAYVKYKDPEIQANGKFSLRLADTTIGTLGSLLAATNYAVYLVSARAPQLIIRYFELKQKYANFHDEGAEFSFANRLIDIIHNKASKIGVGFLTKPLNILKEEEPDQSHITSDDNNTYSAFNDIQNFLGKLEASRTAGSSTLAVGLRKMLDSEGFSPSLFQNTSELHKFITQHGIKDVLPQEEIMKTPSIIIAVRRFMKHLILNPVTSPFFRQERDVHGLTSAQHTQKNIYDSITRFQSVVGRIPIFGWVASPLMSVIKGFFDTRLPDGRKVSSLGTVKPGLSPGLTNNLSINDQASFGQQQMPWMPQAA